VWYVQEVRLLPVIDYEPRVDGVNQRLGPTHIYLARHGRTALNAAGALRGQIDVPLDSVGQRQVSRLGAALAGKKPRLVISSPLLRAVETAEAIASCAGTGTWVDDRLRDRYYGEWAGARVEDVVARWGSLDAAPGVEPAEEVRDRALAALTDIAQNAGGVAAVVVSHDAVNRIALAALDPSLGAPGDLPQDTGCFNTIEYEVQGGGSVKWRVLSVNQVVHETDPPEGPTWTGP
jgi:broad specificity phosphatase PhoE